MEAGIVFYSLALTLVYFAYKTVTSPNPIHCALNLAVTMVGLAFMFFTLGAQFVAWVQIIVYAGAVMVLFLMVLMLFDIKSDLKAFSKGLVGGALKVGSAALLTGMIIGSARYSSDLLGTTTLKPESVEESRQTTQALAQLLFAKYIFVFELLGVLLLVVAVGAVAISRVKGGTHAKH